MLCQHCMVHGYEYVVGSEKSTHCRKQLVIFLKPKQEIFSFCPGRMQYHRPCHPELRGQQPYAFRPPLAFLGKTQPAGHFLSELLRDGCLDVAWAGVPMVLCIDGGLWRGGLEKRGRGEETGLPKRRNGKEVRLASSCA